MRTAIFISILLVGVVFAGLVVLPSMIDWDQYHDRVTTRLEELTGWPARIDGQIDLDFLPKPTLTLALVTLSDAKTSDAAVRLEADRIDLQLRVLPLIRGRVQVEELRLVRPMLHLERLTGDSLGSLRRTGRGLFAPSQQLRVSRLVVIDGKAVVDGAEPINSTTFDSVNLDLTTDPAHGALDIEGGITVAEQPFDISARVAGVTQGAASTLRLRLAIPHPNAEPTILSLRGLASWDPGAPAFRGEATLTGDDVQAGLDAAAVVLQSAAPQLPAGYRRPFEVSGRLEVDSRQIELRDMKLALAGAAGSGRLHLTMTPGPRIDLSLNLPELALAEDVAPSDFAITPAALVPPGWSGRIDGRIGSIAYRDDTIRKVSVNLTLADDGEITIDRAHALLPGHADVRFSGRLTGADHAALEGRLTAVADDLATTLRWLDWPVAEVPEGYLRTLSLSSQLTLADDALRFADAELRIDASRVTGWLETTLGDRLAIETDLTVDRLDVDAYAPDLQPADVLATLSDHLGQRNAEFKATIDRLTWRGLRLQEIALLGRASEGRLTLEELSLQGVAKSDAALSGAIDFASGQFELEAKGETGAPAQLLRRFGFDPPIALARLSPLGAAIDVAGRMDAFDLEAQLHHGEGKLTLAGGAGWIDNEAQYDLAIDAVHPDFLALAKTLGLRPPRVEETSAAPFSLSGKLKATPEAERSAAGSVRLGAMSVTGRALWQDLEPRPKLTGQISVGEPSIEGLTALAALAGLRLQPKLIDPSWLGNWPDQPLPLAWLAAIDGDLKFSGKGGLLGPGLELEARLDDGLLYVDRLAAQLEPGTLEAELSFDVRREVPLLALAVDLDALDLATLERIFALVPTLDGQADLYVEATASGRTPHDLVRSLVGDVEIAIEEGQLQELGRLRRALVRSLSTSEAEVAAKLPDLQLTGRFDLKRGIATAQSVEVEVGPSQGTLEGMIDLLLWVSDLNLELNTDAAPLALQIVGPLDRLQTRLLEPRSNPVTPAPAAAP